MAETRNQTIDGLQYYSYLLFYLGDIFCSHHNADGGLQQLHWSFPVKQRFGSHDIYIGAKLCKTRLGSQVLAWAMSPIRYVHEGVRNGETIKWLITLVDSELLREQIILLR